MALVVAQVGGNVTTATATISATFGSATTTGSLVAGIDHVFNTSGVAAGGDLTDNKGPNTFTLITSSFGGAGAAGISGYYNNAGTRGASHQLTANLVNSAGESCNLAMIEVTGQDATTPLDSTTPATATTGSSPFNVTSAAAISGNQIAIYGVTIDTGTNTTFTAPTGYSNIINNGNGVTSLVSGAFYKINETGTPTVGATGTWTVTAAREIFFTFKEAAGGAVAAGGPPPAPLFGPGSQGPLAWQWQQQVGVDAPPPTAAPAQPWAQTIQQSALAIPPQSALIIPGLFPGLIETVPVPVFILSSAQPQPLVSAVIVGGWNPSAVETIPVPILVTADNLTVTPFPSAILEAFESRQVETVPVPILVSADNITIGLQQALVVVSALSPSDVETVPVPRVIQALNLVAPLQAMSVALGLTPGTAPVTSFFVPTIQAQSIQAPLQPVSVALGLTPGTAPFTGVFVPVIQAAAITPLLQRAVHVPGLHHPLIETVPVFQTVQNRLIVPTVQQIAALTVLTPPPGRFVPTIYGAAIPIALRPAQVTYALIPGIAPIPTAVIYYATLTWAPLSAADLDAVPIIGEATSVTSQAEGVGTITVVARSSCSLSVAPLGDCELGVEGL